MSSLLTLYNKQILDFLSTMTVKFTPINDLYNDNLRYTYPIDETSPETWKYYLNISGQYHASDTMMTVRSLDTGDTINFTREMLPTHPKTAKAYRVGNKEYTILCDTYPEQTDLIKSIVYPADINKAISAADFTILSYGSGYLEDTEETVILHELRKFIEYAVSRWYFPFMKYEVYYNWTFWGMLWNKMFEAILAARVKYLHTANVHSFHIWWELASYGIGDYRDILTRRQAMFLYRNIVYIQANRGKQSNLILLTNEILGDIGVGLVGKNIFQQTDTGTQECRWIPEFVSEVIPTYLANSINVAGAETMTDIDYRLVGAGMDYDISTSYIDGIERRIGNTTLNTLPTKLLEIKKINLDTKYGYLLNRFILDTLVSMVVSGKYTTTVDFIDPVTSSNIKLTAKEALALYYYCIHRAKGETPLVSPNVYSSASSYRHDINISQLPTKVVVDHASHHISNLFRVEDLLAGVTIPSIPITDNDEFGNYVAEQFLPLVRMVRYSRRSANMVILKALRLLFPYICQTKTYPISLINEQYIPWLEYHNLTKMIQIYDASSNRNSIYINLANEIISQLVPTDNPVYKKYSNQSEVDSSLYDRLRELFTQLCSYNVLFLDTDRSSEIWIPAVKMAANMEAPVGDTTIMAVVGIPSVELGSAGDIDIAITTDDMVLDITTQGTLAQDIVAGVDTVVTNSGEIRDYIDAGLDVSVYTARSTVQQPAIVMKTNRLIRMAIIGPSDSIATA